MADEFSCTWKVSGDIENPIKDYRTGFIAFQKGCRDGDVQLRLGYKMYQNTNNKYLKAPTYHVKRKGKKLISRVLFPNGQRIVIAIDRTSISLTDLSHESLTALRHRLSEFDKNIDINAHNKNQPFVSPPHKPSVKSPIISPGPTSMKMKKSTPPTAEKENMCRSTEKCEELASPIASTRNFYGNNRPSPAARSLFPSTPPATAFKTYSQVFSKSPKNNRVNTLREVENISPPANMMPARRVHVVQAKPRSQALTLSTSPTPDNPILAKKQKQGFVNIGNSCFMNAIIQCMFHQEPYVSDIGRMGKIIQTRNLTHKTKDNLCAVLYSLLCNQRKAYPTKYLLQQMMNFILELVPHFERGKQQDANELYGYLLNRTQEEMVEINNLLEKSYNGTDKVEPFQPPTLNFETLLCRTRKCDECGAESSTKDPCYSLSVDISGTKGSLQQSVAKYFEDEAIEDYQCEQCSKKGAHVSVAITRLPRTLGIHLQRSQYNNGAGEKQHKRVVIPRYINLSSHTAPGVESPAPEIMRDLHPFLQRGERDLDSSAEELFVSPTKTPVKTPPPTVSPTMLGAAKSKSAPTTPRRSVSRSPTTSLLFSPVSATPAPTLAKSPPAMTSSPVPKTSPSATTSSFTPSLASVCGMSSSTVATTTTLSINAPLMSQVHKPASAEKSTDGPNSGEKRRSSSNDDVPVSKRPKLSTSTSSTADAPCPLCGEVPCSCESVSCLCEGPCQCWKVFSQVDGASDQTPKHLGSVMLEKIRRRGVETINALRPLVTGAKATVEDTVMTEDTGVGWGDYYLDQQQQQHQHHHQQQDGDHYLHHQQQQDRDNYTVTNLDSNTTYVVPTDNPQETVAAFPDPAPAQQPTHEQVAPLDYTVPTSPAAASSQGFAIGGEGDESIKYPTTAEDEEEQFRRALEQSLAESTEQKQREETAIFSPAESLEEEDASGQDDEVPKGQHVYRLMSVISHIGEAEQGHYMADVFDQQNERWFTFSDDAVADTSEAWVRRKRQTTGYMFFYMHMDVYEETMRRMKIDKEKQQLRARQMTPGKENTEPRWRSTSTSAVTIVEEEEGMEQTVPWDNDAG